MAEKKNGDYEKPESHDVGEDELEDVSGGAGSGGRDCGNGDRPGSDYACNEGGHATRNCWYGGLV